MHYVVVLGGDVRLTLKAMVCLGFGGHNNLIT